MFAFTHLENGNRTSEVSEIWEAEGGNMGTLHHAPVPEKTGMLPLPGDMSRVSEEEYWETYYEMPDITYEWNNGVLEERPMGDTE
ncbi:MAG: hypothetical protein DRI57_24040, partial [Deltaproteobacteria bacterium]